MTEKLSYEVIKRKQGVELRRYPAHIKAEVDVPGVSYQKAIYQGFGMLAGYIFGENKDIEKIAMTSPVQVSNSSKIQMTKPVEVHGDDVYSVAFIMPAEHTLETLPRPKNQSVHLTPIASEVRAALRFSGYFSENKVQRAKKKLKDWLLQAGVESTGDFIVARYNPPWVPWFLARNEVMIQIKYEPDCT